MSIVLNISSLKKSKQTMDVLSPEQRSHNMSRIRGKNTKPEMLIRKWLWAQGYRYRLHEKSLPGSPDIVFVQQRKVIFVHGCFWHKHDCSCFHWPETNENFWKKKIKENYLRDQRNYQILIAEGWEYLVIWTCEIKKELSQILDKLVEFLR